MSLAERANPLANHAISGVGTVAVDAFFFHRLMKEFLSAEGFDLVSVTLKTRIISACAEEVGKVRLVGVVTHRTAAHGYRTMDVFPGENFLVVAEKT